MKRVALIGLFCAVTAVVTAQVQFVEFRGNSPTYNRAWLQSMANTYRGARAVTKESVTEQQLATAVLNRLHEEYEVAVGDFYTSITYGPKPLERQYLVFIVVDATGIYYKLYVTDL